MTSNALKRTLEDFSDIKELFNSYSTHLCRKYTESEAIIEQRMKLELCEGIFFDSDSDNEDHKQKVYLEHNNRL